MFCKYRKKLLASPRVHLVSSFFVTKKLPYVVTRDVCPSVRLSVCPSVRPSVRRLWKYLWNAVAR